MLNNPLTFPTQPHRSTLTPIRKGANDYYRDITATGKSSEPFKQLVCLHPAERGRSFYEKLLPNLKL